jgi:hypothetical protein
MNYLTVLQEHVRLFWRLRNGTKISNAKSVRFYLKLFLGEGSYENPREIKSVGFVSGARLCHEREMSATTNNYFFVIKEWPEKARNILYNI